LQLKLLEHLETIWREPDQSIWEVRSGPQHFTYSKVMAWVAFDRAIQSVERFNLPGLMDRWRRLRAEIHDEVRNKGYDRQQQAFTQRYGWRSTRRKEGRKVEVERRGHRKAWSYR
jgi:GH15 family glucan-1,4-alpha-glucosidase